MGCTLCRQIVFLLFWKAILTSFEMALELVVQFKRYCGKYGFPFAFMLLIEFDQFTVLLLNLLPLRLAMDGILSS